MKKNNFKLIIFDFDGTIADTFQVFIEGVNAIYREKGLKVITLKEKANLKI